MNKFIYILSLVIILCSCTKDPVNVRNDNDNDTKVSINLSVIVPELQPLSKAMGEKPDLQNLYLAVFDQAGYLAEYVKADPVELANDNGVTCSYTVKLSLSDNPRTIHWIGNAPESGVRYGSEESVMMNLKSSGNEDIYWYRKVVHKIDAVPTADANGVEASETLLKDLSNIPLIRNFAKILLVDKADSFQLESYAVVNTLSEGYAVAYNFSKGEFVDYMKLQQGNEGQSEVLVPKSYKELLAEGYNASTPTLSTKVSLEEAWSRKVNEGDAFYVYEREKPLSSPAYIIAYGTYNGATKGSYYKINLRDEEDSYMPLLRNFQYTISLNAVYRDGYATIEEAAASSGSGDVSTALETESLIYMSDGNASLEVEYTDIVVRNSDPIYLPFAFYPNLFDKETLYKGNSTGNYQETIELLINNDAGITGPSIVSVELEYPDEGYPRVKITPTEVENNPKSQTFTILVGYLGSNGIHRTLQRKIKVTVMSNQLMSITCLPNEIPNLQDEKFAVDITIPAGLSRGMFPLDFRIESQNLCITPNLEKNALNVETGKSITSSGKPAYFFIKHLDWIDYQSLQNVNGTKTLTAYFKSTKNNSVTDIYVANDYFYGMIGDERKSYAATSLGNYLPLYFENVKFTPSVMNTADNQQTTLEFTVSDVPKDGKIILLLYNLEPSEDENCLTQLEGIVDGKKKYEYSVTSSTGTRSIHLIAPDGSLEPSVTLKGYHFKDTTVSITRAN